MAAPVAVLVHSKVLAAVLQYGTKSSRSSRYQSGVRAEVAVRGAVLLALEESVYISSVIVVFSLRCIPLEPIQQQQNEGIAGVCTCEGIEL